MKIVDSPECHLCKNTPETIERAFIECQETHTLQRQVELCMVLKCKIKISDSEKIFGTAYKNSIIDTVILLTKKRKKKEKKRKER